MFVDTHCHIFSSDYEDIDQVIKNANLNNITKFINNASDINSCQEVLKLVEQYPSMYAALGIHPEFCDTYQQKDLDFIEENISNNKVVAIGEIGLDYYYTKENKAKQIVLLEQQLKLAQKYNLPVIIHNREATGDLINILKKYNVKGVIHCFNGSLETAKELINMGYYLGINGVITFKNCKLKEVIKEVPLDRVVLETDCPYLTPEPYRGKKNEPKYIKVIAEFLAQIYDLDVCQVEKTTNENIRRIFDI